VQACPSEQLLHAAVSCVNSGTACNETTSDHDTASTAASSQVRA
jgi:hypothetical protein